MQRALADLAAYHSSGRRVYVKRSPRGGYGLFARTALSEGTTVAAYPVETFFAKDDDDWPDDTTYILAIRALNGHVYDNWGGRVTPQIVRGSCRSSRLPEIGLFSNEASGSEPQNTLLVFPMVTAKRIRPGMIVRATLQIIRPVAPGQELLTCYGSAYDRHYSTNCCQ